MTLLKGGRYEFHVTQRLTREAVAAFRGFSVTDTPSGTVLLGHVRDDDELRDLLSRMQRLRLRIMDVRRLPDLPGDQRADADAARRTAPSPVRQVPSAAGSGGSDLVRTAAN